MFVTVSISYPAISEFCFSSDPPAQELLDRVSRQYRIHACVNEWEAHAWVHRCLSFVGMRGVADAFVGPDFSVGDFRVWLLRFPVFGVTLLGTMLWPIVILIVVYKIMSCVICVIFVCNSRFTKK